MSVKKLITILLIIIQLLAFLFPTLSSEAPLPTSLASNELGAWLGRICAYWSRVFHNVTNALNRSLLKP